VEPSDFNVPDTQPPALADALLPFPAGTAEPALVRPPPPFELLPHAANASATASTPAAERPARLSFTINSPSSNCLPLGR
jgi:hypothetical protein